MGIGMNLLRGTVAVTAQGAFPERLLNLCAQEGVVFWGLQWVDDTTVRFTVRRAGLPQLRTLIGRLGYTLTVSQGRGLPFFLGRFRHRYAFLAGLALSVATVLVLSSFVLTIEVVGNQQVATGEILTQLDRLGLEVGVFGPSLDRITLAQEALLELDGLSFMAINRYGTRIEVLVREVQGVPELAQRAGLSHIYAQADGIVEEMQVMRGRSVVEVGDTVAAGDLLITGEVELEPPIYTDAPSQWLEVVAQGLVYARTWRTVEGEIPLTATTKEYTGEETAKYTLTVLGNTINIFESGSILGTEYDKMINVYPCTLPDGTVLPLSLTLETCRGYETQETQVDATAAQSLLEERLLAQLESPLEEGEQVVATQYSARIVDGMLMVTLTAECQEEIGVQREAEPTVREEQGTVPVE